jgi:hypothetical protein
MSGIVGASYFGGNYAAFNFAYGVNPRVAALSVHNAPIAASTTALTVAFGYATTHDGIQFYPLATTAPVHVGIDSNFEAVTPSAVSASSEAYGAMNFTAVFADAHAEGDPVASATVGLQEAINFAQINGGGNVIIDATWTAAGGTTGIKDAAVFASPVIVTIVDNR